MQVCRTSKSIVARLLAIAKVRTLVQVVGRAEPHNLALIHPEQNRVLTIRENARTQVWSHRIIRVQI